MSCAKTQRKEESVPILNHHDLFFALCALRLGAREFFPVEPY